MVDRISIASVRINGCLRGIKRTRILRSVHRTHKLCDITEIVFLYIGGFIVFVVDECDYSVARRAFPLSPDKEPPITVNVLHSSVKSNDLKAFLKASASASSSS